MNSQPPANPGVRAIPARGVAPSAPAHPSPARSDSDAVPPDGDEGSRSGRRNRSGEGSGSGDESESTRLNHEPGRPPPVYAAARKRGQGPTTTTPADRPTAAANKWGAVKGKVVAPRTPGVADVAVRVVAEMARSRRPAKD